MYRQIKHPTWISKYVKGFFNGKGIKLTLMHKSDTTTVGHHVGEVIIFLCKLTLSPKCYLLSLTPVDPNYYYMWRATGLRMQVPPKLFNKSLNNLNKHSLRAIQYWMPHLPIVRGFVQGPLSLWLHLKLALNTMVPLDKRMSATNYSLHLWCMVHQETG